MNTFLFSTSLATRIQSVHTSKCALHKGECELHESDGSINGAAVQIVAHTILHFLLGCGSTAESHVYFQSW